MKRHAISYGNATPTTQNGDTYFTLPTGSGTCELSVSSPGSDTVGVIMLVMTDAEGNDHYLSSQTFTTVASIIERGRYITATNNPGRQTSTSMTPDTNICMTVRSPPLAAQFDIRGCPMTGEALPQVSATITPLLTNPC